MKQLTAQQQEMLIDRIEALGVRAVKVGISTVRNQVPTRDEVIARVAAAYVHEFMATVRAAFIGGGNETNS